jgi:hypothetical protein
MPARGWASSWLNWGPGYRGSGMRPGVQVPVSAYQARLTGLPLTGGQAQGIISAQGAATLRAGPQGLGNVWYPAQATISTTTGAADTSTCAIFLGSIGLATNLVGQSYAGGGDTVALAVPPLVPGYFLIAVWSGGHSGDQCAFNLIGTMDALKW